jgi:glutaredoxin
MKLELYYFDACPFCQVVLKHIDALGIGSKIILKNTMTNREFQQYHSSKTGRNTVPCLYIDGEPMFESLDINAWLTKNKNNF